LIININIYIWNGRTYKLEKMSYYYKYNFISPEGIYSTIREELKSYMDAGVIDDLMFPTYLNKCLEKLGKSSYSITETILHIEDFTSRLPDNFYAVREAWLCGEIDGNSYQYPSSFYSQAASSSTILVSPITIGDSSCLNPECVDGCPECIPNLVQAVYKTNNSITFTYQRKYLLKPGNISVRQDCDVNYMQNWTTFSQNNMGKAGIPYSSTYDSFDIRDNKFVTTFRKGVVDMVFYATDYDETGNQMVPDNYRVKEFIESFIKYKMFEQLMNVVTDESINQIERKLQYYKQLADEAYVMALTEIRSQTIWEKQRAIKKGLRRLDMYELPGNDRRKRTWRRNR